MRFAFRKLIEETSPFIFYEWRSESLPEQRTLMTPSAKSAIDRSPHARILVRATNWIGDTVMTMPAVQRLRELERDAHISLLCPAKLHDLWRHNPFLNEVIADLDNRKFDVAIIFPNS